MVVYGDEEDKQVIDSNDNGTSEEVSDTSETELENPKAAPGESVRESIRRALEQTNEDEESPIKEPKEEKLEIKDPATKVETKEVKTSDNTKAAPPPGWTKDGKAEWEKLPKAVQESILKREDEVGTGFKDYSSKNKELETKLNEFETFFAPHKADFEKAGMKPLQVVDQMFKWVAAFAQPNKEEAKKALLQLGSNYGIKFDATPITQKPENNTQDSQVPEGIKTFVTDVTGKITALESKLTAAEQTRVQNEARQRQDSANQFLDTWAKDKPHYQKVRGVMSSLLRSGVIPLKNGTDLDLDSAYNQAIYAVPEVRELVLQEANEKKQAEEKVAKDKERLKNLEKARAARTAGSSATTRAPTGNTNSSKNNGKSPSARDSIKAAMQELKDR